MPHDPNDDDDSTTGKLKAEIKAEAAESYTTTKGKLAGMLGTALLVGLIIGFMF